MKLVSPYVSVCMLLLAACGRDESGDAGVLPSGLGDASSEPAAQGAAPATDSPSSPPASAGPSSPDPEAPPNGAAPLDTPAGVPPLEAPAGAEPNPNGGSAVDAGRPSTPPAPLLEHASTAERPQLARADAATYDVLEYLASSGSLDTGLVRDDWNPTAGVGDALGFTPDYRVAASGGTHTSVQAAIDAAVSAGGSARRFVEVAAGEYREVVCVPASAPPLTLYSRDLDATRTRIAFDNFAGRAKPAGTPANPCNPNTNSTTFGTSGSVTFANNADDFQAANVSFVNDTDETGLTGSIQAVALSTRGDRAVFENVRVLGNQDSLLVNTPSAGVVTRAYFKRCYVEGDTDFIFGRGALVLDGCSIHSLTSRTARGVILAPSSDARAAFGMLVTRSTFTADASAAEASTHLGRAWDEGQGDLAAYAARVATGVYPNGQAVIRESILGAHIQSTAPWRSAASSDRPFASTPSEYPANRFSEFANSGPGSGPL